MKIVTAAQMQALDRRTIMEAGVPGATLMERAGTGVVKMMEEVVGPLTGKAVVIVCGKGNNGGDGLVVARLLRAQRARVHVILVADADELKGDAGAMYRRLTKSKTPVPVHTHPSLDHMRLMLKQCDVIVDALLGTGLSAPVTGAYREAIDAINECSAAAGLPVTAVDLPSGIHADSGAVLGTAVRASLTVTFGLPKVGLYVGEGIDHAGDIRMVDIGIPAAYVDELDSRLSLITADTLCRLIPQRSSSSHKGTFGHAGIIAGSIGKTGAAALSAKAALRSGAGLVTVATPAGVNATLEGKLLEVMTMPMPDTAAQTFSVAAIEPLTAFLDTRTAVAIGPGISTHAETIEVVRALIRRLHIPSVLDADALNALAGKAELLDSCKISPVLTPHPGEMARLGGSDSPRTVNADRLGTATRFAQRHGVVLVLKGARTVVADPDGRAAICPTGNPGMATAGTGDALTGIIVGLLAQGLSAWDAACAGTYLHGLAGDLAAADLGVVGMTAGDLIERIPYAVARILNFRGSSYGASAH
ncbi:MAG TPA: NAD(P)H-hydrate dehydratase [Nitrospiraceae bacterium]|nr:NAD(P)H-hydrate dehydratase [Nitrospiraceae bacterium]